MRYQLRGFGAHSPPDDKSHDGGEKPNQDAEYANRQYQVNGGGGRRLVKDCRAGIAKAGRRTFGAS